VSDCCVTPIEQFISAISWREQVIFDEMVSALL